MAEALWSTLRDWVRSHLIHDPQQNFPANLAQIERKYCLDLCGFLYVWGQDVVEGERFSHRMDYFVYGALGAHAITLCSINDAQY